MTWLPSWQMTITTPTRLLRPRRRLRSLRQRQRQRRRSERTKHAGMEEQCNERAWRSEVPCLSSVRDQYAANTIDT
jgi:hypothetical protein